MYNNNIMGGAYFIMYDTIHYCTGYHNVLGMIQSDPFMVVNTKFEDIEIFHEKLTD